MCRNIKVLANFSPPATAEEIHASALQYVRKLSGSAKPAKGNQETFDRAVAKVVKASTELLESLVTSAAPKNREQEAEKAKERNRRRFGKA
ncbi:MAG: DUF2277 domain-containing protein [Kofleriaceae bacterium]|nr:DUF2277 domain-containing protein [Kofleriaceae bacterium]